ncbi:hypothetical protein JR316_0002274 [Psilocybe cubensis]|uniref:Zn(2)-C6 fungal-type domain-containing protein n=2 Tax=Psilocybe cubensis TaxID=181762 RepID=A0A8H7Y7Y3_PSICU|nr:hypothetical protein JR316_0002274 [Psilocybe cubensis]KAH9485366.1 hypothetical protein JR316_0002274 [Psilocybe cubensis]
MYTDSPPVASSYASPPLTPFQEYQRERQQQFYRVFPAARYHDITQWASLSQYSPSPIEYHDLNNTFGGPVFQYDTTLTSSGLDRGYTAVDTGALQNRAIELPSQQYSTQAYYESYPASTDLEQCESDRDTTVQHSTNLHSGSYYTPTSPDVVSYYSEQSNHTTSDTISYHIPVQQIPTAYNTTKQQYSNVQADSPSVEASYIPSYSQHTNYEHTYPNHNDAAPIVDLQPPISHSHYQQQATAELSSSQRTHFSEPIPQPLIPIPGQLPNTQYPNHEGAQAPSPVPSPITRRIVPEGHMRHETESLSANSSSSTRTAPRTDRHSPRSTSHIPSQAPNSPEPSGTGWMGPPSGPPLLHQPRPLSMPLSPLPTKRQLEKKPPLACLFCRGRKIACGPPIPGSTDRTCNQCQRRSLPCEYPTESRRGMRKKKVLDSVETASKSSSTASPSADSAD